MNIETRKYKIRGITRVLGAQAANPNVRSEFIAKKAATQEKGDEETAKLPEELEKENLSVFLRDDGALCLSDYVIKGFLKEAMSAMKLECGVLAATSKIDNFILVTPAYLRFTRGGEEIKKPDFVLERPLRAMTMQGPRVTVSASEAINPGWELEFELTLLENAGTAKSKALTFDVIDKALEYGWMKGLGQWRNGQNGRFKVIRDGE